MTELDVTCRRTGDGDDWTCEVEIDVDRGSSTRHVMTVKAADLERLDPDAEDPHLLVNRSFRFLLAREPATSILRSFDLTEIGRYFPDYEAAMTAKD